MKRRILIIGIAALMLISGIMAGLAANDANDKSNVPPKTETTNVTEQVPPKPPEQETTTVKHPTRHPQIPTFREAVIIYFKETPSSLEEFASSYNVKLIFAKPDIKMAAFETNPTGKPGKTSQKTLDFINKVSKNPNVEKAYRDGFMFTRPDKIYTTEPKITYPEDLEKQGARYVPNEVIVGFWRLPPSLEEFASKYGVSLKRANTGLLSATFKVNDASEFIKKASIDPYISYIEPNGVVYGGHIPNDPKWNTEQVSPASLEEFASEMTYPEDLEKQGVKREYILNKVLVGFWRLPPSLDEFASKHGGKLVGFDDANRALLYASFETSNVSEFIRNVSTDPYVRDASPDASYYSLAYVPNDPKWDFQ